MLQTNVVEKEPFHKSQQEMLHMLKDALVSSFGPMGSYTQIIKEGQFNKYTKDGYTILNEIKHNKAIEMFGIQDIVEVARNTVKLVGDGTTSAVIMSSLFFDEIYENEELKKYPPVLVADAIKSVAGELVDLIREQKKEATPEDIYNIAYVSTNGNEDIANRLKQVYAKYGNNVFIDVAISTTAETLLKEYNGMTIDVGYADPCYVNTTKGVSSVNNPRIYAFHDPIDTPEMQAFMMQIIQNNILTHSQDGKYIPTVIMAPKIGADVGAYLQLLTNNLASVAIPMRPPLLVVTNIFDFDNYIDIVTMCGCKWIKKYLDPKLQEADIKKGLAPTLENISEWGFGGADQVEADTMHTQFINPKLFWETKPDVENEGVHSKEYNNYIAWLKGKLEESEQGGNANAATTGALKRRINSLNANMVEYLVGGISPTDRDADRDLVEDAVLNCRSAAKNGYGRASNIEGLLASDRLNGLYSSQLIGNVSDAEKVKMHLKDTVAKAYYNAYEKLLKLLYGTMMINDEEIFNIISTIREKGVPYDIRNREFSDKIISSIESDVVVIQSIAKIVSIMVTSNQCLLASPVLNLYSEK